MFARFETTNVLHSNCYLSQVMEKEESEEEDENEVRVLSIMLLSF